MRIVQSIIVIFFLSINLSCIKNVRESSSSTREFSTIHGRLVIDDPLAIELIESEAMQRLKYINQYGIYEYVVKTKRPYDRFTHSLGVYYILKKFNAPRKEQIAGLLHDISHTAFSHSTDPLFMGDLVSGAYQDQIHVEFLKKHGVEKILKKYGFLAKDMDLLAKNYPMLKKNHPDLCVDRIEYIIYAGFKEKFLSQQEIKKMHNDLAYEKGHWYFRTVESATKFAEISLHETLERWGGPAQVYLNHKSIELFKTAFKHGIVKKEDILYERVDDEIWEDIANCNNKKIRKIVSDLKNHKINTMNRPKTCKQVFYSKFRGVDPYVLDGDDLKRLTAINRNYKYKYKRAKKKIEQGFCLQI